MFTYLLWGCYKPPIIPWMPVVLVLAHVLDIKARDFAVVPVGQLVECSGFHNTDSHRRVFRQSGRQSQSSHSCADHNIVESVVLPWHSERCAKQAAAATKWFEHRRCPHGIRQAQQRELGQIMRSEHDVQFQGWILNVVRQAVSPSWSMDEYLYCQGRRGL